MSLDKATVARIAALARIEVPEAEQERLAGELSQILGGSSSWARSTPTGVEPMTLGDADAARTGARTWSPTAAGRERDPAPTRPSAQDGFFVVPKVVE